MAADVVRAPACLTRQTTPRLVMALAIAAIMLLQNVHGDATQPLAGSTGTPAERQTSSGAHRPVRTHMSLPGASRRRRLQEPSSRALAIMDVDLAQAANAIAEDAADWGVLDEEHQRLLFDRYKQLFVAKNISLRALSCSAPEEDGTYALDWHTLNGTELTGPVALLMRDCINTEVEVVGDVAVQYALFFNNSVDGGAPLYVTEQSSLTIANAIFLSNTGTAASALYVATDAVMDAAGIVVHANAQRRVDGSGAAPDTAIDVINGCLQYLTTSAFVGNGLAPPGELESFVVDAAALYLTAEYYNGACDVDIRDVRAVSNKAQEWGGAMFFFTVRNLMLIDSTLRGNRLANCAGRNTSKIWSRGGAMVAYASQIYLYNNTWQDNTACLEGGAAYISVYSLTAIGDVFSDNSATEGSGGALCVIGWVNLTSVRIVNNTALRGGGMWLDAYRYSPTFKACNFTANTATFLGGGLQGVDFQQITISGCVFSRNHAGSGGAAAIQVRSYTLLENSTFYSNTAGTDQPDATTCQEATGRLGAGGALCLDIVPVNAAEAALAARSDQGYIPEINITSCRFEGNNATNGGAVAFALPCSDGDLQSCQHLKFEGNNSLVGNAAIGGSGAAVWMPEPALLESQCEANLDETMGWTPTMLCPAWLDGDAGEGQLAGLLASEAHGLVLGVGSPGVTCGDTEVVVLSSTSSPMGLNVYVSIQDKFNRIVEGGSADSRTTIFARAEGADIIGAPMVTASQGVAHFDNLAIRGVPQRHTLVFETESLSGHKLRANLTVVVRPCRVGEVQTSNDDCMPCGDSEVFSFNPRNKSCDLCPANANCSSSATMALSRSATNPGCSPPAVPIGAVLVPLPGFWHSSPRSPLIHRCPFKAACTGRVGTSAGPDRQSSIVAYQASIVDGGVPLDAISIAAYNQLLCAEGYTGNLCAVCEPGYGHRQEGECVKCSSSALNSFLIVVAVLVRVVMLGITIASQLLAFHDLRGLLDNDADVVPTPDLGMDGPLPVSRTDSNHVDSTHAAADGVVVVRRLSLSTQVEQTLEQHVERQFPSDATVLKILVNFLQITAITRGMSLELPDIVVKALDVAGFVANGVRAWISFDCSLSTRISIPKSIQATVISVAIPLLILLAAVPFWLVCWAAEGLWRKKGRRMLRPFLGTRMRITALGLMLYFYPSLVELVLSIFRCAKLDDAVWNDGAAAVGAVGRWWTSDYSLQCYEGRHLVLALALGVPGAVLICAGWPVGLALFLRINQWRLKTPKFAASYALIYADYSDRYFFWETVSMARKLALVSIAVFIDATKPILKLMVSAAVLELAAALAAVNPYRLPRMCRLERAAQRVNIFTILLLLLFFVEISTDALKVAATALLVALNSAFTIYLVLQILREALHTVMMDLDGTARGLLLASDLVSMPTDDPVGKMKKRVVTLLVPGLLAKLPYWLARWWVMYPCSFVRLGSASTNMKQPLITEDAVADVVDLPTNFHTSSPEQQSAMLRSMGTA